MSERFFRSSRPGYPHPVSSELESSDIRVAVGDCSVTERRRWRPPYQTSKTACARKTLQTQRGRTHGAGVCGNGSVPLSHSGNVVTRIGIHTHFRFSVLFNSFQSCQDDGRAQWQTVQWSPVYVWVRGPVKADIIGIVS